VHRIQIDRSLCSGFGSCADLAPRSVRLGPDGLAEPTAPDTEDDDVLEAAASCPMGAIAVLDETGAQVA
jgi:ferredoxin